jgi:hypothetical protein
LYKAKIFDFLHLLNDLCTRLDSALQQENKQLLLILDGLEKVRDVEIINKIFNTTGINNLKNILCRKVIVCPVHLSALNNNTSSTSNDEFLISLKVFDNPLTHKTATLSDKVIHNRALLTKLLHTRIHEKHHDLIDEAALTIAIEKSGGFMYDFIGILQNSIIEAINAGSDIVRKDHVSSAVSSLEFSKSGSFTYDSHAIDLLYHVLNNYTTPEEKKDNTFTQQVLRNNLIITKNDVRCYFVHPLIQKTVEVYGKSLAESAKSE